MEKRSIPTGKVTDVKNILIVFLLCGLIFICAASCKTRKDGANMSAPTTLSSEILHRVINLNQSGIGNSEQIILVTNDSIHSKDVIIQTFEKSNNEWRKKFDDIKGTIGSRGFSSWQQKREGDKTSPTGIYKLGPVFGYAQHADTRMDYRMAAENDYWIDDPASDDYNKWVTTETAPAVSHEVMKRHDNLYKLGIVVQYNTDHIVKGNGSAIFIHIQGSPGNPTSGCVALPETDLYRIVQWLEKKKQPLIIMGTLSELEQLQM